MQTLPRNVATEFGPYRLVIQYADDSLPFWMTILGRKEAQAKVSEILAQNDVVSVKAYDPFGYDARLS